MCGLNANVETGYKLDDMNVFIYLFFMYFFICGLFHDAVSTQTI
jgi:hypothetical protein